ncbi:MAG: hypothetical protein P8I55_09630 [Crocinitomix sp.]|nr:hypothetical protein [Crocinitomix sp.]
MKLRLLTLLLCLIGFQQISFASGQLVGLGAIEQAMYWGPVHGDSIFPFSCVSRKSHLAITG